MKFLKMATVTGGMITMLMSGITRCLGQDDTAQVVPPRSSGNEVSLFNGKDFTGWTFCMKNQADPRQTWSVTNGVIHCTGKPTGYLRTTQTYSNYFLTVEWRFVKVTPKADNTGLLVDR